jgi:hypothetical protein
MCTAFFFVQWKAIGDIVYKRTAAAELHPIFREPLARGSPIRRVDGVARGSPLRRVDGVARGSAGGSHGEAHDDRNIFVQVDELLERLINLTSDLPTSGARMRNIVGLFTPGKGPSEAEIDAAHNFDCGQLHILNLSVSNVRSAFVQFKHSQDVKCARYEQEAEALVKEMDRRENVVRASLSDRAAADVCFFFMSYVNCFCINIFFCF